jgi:hypothetical protein
MLEDKVMSVGARPNPTRERRPGPVPLSEKGNPCRTKLQAARKTQEKKR